MLNPALTRLLIASLHQKNILITGGTGYIGRHFVAALADVIEKHSLETRLLVLTRQSLKSYGPVVYLQGDVRNIDIEEPVDYICHLACSANPRDYATRPEEMVDVILDGTHRVVELAEEKSVKRLLMMSSGAVYGNKHRTDSPIKETLQPELSAANIYAQAKARAEHICLSTERDVVVARGFAFYGKDQPHGWGFAIADMIHQARTQGEIVVQNQGTVRSFLHIDDCSTALMHLLFGHCDYSIYNLGSAQVMSIVQAAQVMAARENVPLRCCDHFQHNYYVPNVTRLRQQFGWEEQHTLSA